MSLAELRLKAALLLEGLHHPTRRGVLRALGVVPLLLVGYTLLLIPFTPGISDIRKARQEQPARVLSADGRELASYKWANREWVRLEQISPKVKEALIATEDHRFHEHHGIDFYRLGGALLRTFSGNRQGGSTLTQQLARNLFPDEIGRAPTLTRKLKEAITALKIELVYSKEMILETYLNTVPFLYNAWGIEMAARTYFDKPARQLDVLEAATLVGMLKGNSYYNPVLNPERAVARRNIVLAQMVKRGVLEESRLAGLQRKPLRIDFERQLDSPGPAPHFAQQLRKWLIAWADAHDYNIYTDGLVVHTTLDSRLQAQAVRAVERRGRLLQGLADQAWSGRRGWEGSPELVNAFIRESREYRAALTRGEEAGATLTRLRSDRVFLDALRKDKTRVQLGFLALDPRNGQVRAWVGSRDFTLDPFDHVAQARRQPGSTFKPFVYGAAFDQGWRPADSMLDQPVEIQLRNGEVWRPEDPLPPSGQPVSLKDGLVYSRNRVTAQLMQEVGPARVARLARKLGVRQSPLEEVPSLALGTSPVTLKEMVVAYGSLANGGAYLEPVLVTRIEDREGRVLEAFAPADPEEALAPETAYTLVDVMRGVVDRGTGVAIRQQFGLRADLAGKTGTTQDNTDGWFILMHPQLVGGAWVGFNDARISLRSDYWGQGARSALPVVGDVFHYALTNRLVDSKVRFVSRIKPGWLERGWNWLQARVGLSGPR
ncbi:transglycosylase domain-containing protein [Zoogloea sp.]|uniref:penicillin-binding protein 1A n=1 Tax=Zoogloea sp. TaxID=49181 RepID=UPI00260B701C|nr:transglycosylase domain-containing protein [Zoogloea sp.]MDD3353701.1 transglycosylase domain-containing protein [Zoogloea sp.]